LAPRKLLRGLVLRLYPKAVCHFTFDRAWLRLGVQRGQLAMQLGHLPGTPSHLREVHTAHIA